MSARASNSVGVYTALFFAATLVLLLPACLAGAPRTYDVPKGPGNCRLSANTQVSEVNQYYYLPKGGKELVKMEEAGKFYPDCTAVFNVGGSYAQDAPWRNLWSCLRILKVHPKCDEEILKSGKVQHGCGAEGLRDPSVSSTWESSTVFGEAVYKQITEICKKSSSIEAMPPFAEAVKDAAKHTDLTGHDGAAAKPPTPDAFGDAAKKLAHNVVGANHPLNSNAPHANAGKDAMRMLKGW